MKPIIRDERMNGMEARYAQLLDLRKKAGEIIGWRFEPFGLRLAKTVMNMGADRDLSSALALEREAFAMLFATEDQKEGVRAFNEKRKPDFKGR